MVPVEPVSLSISAVALAGLFSTCLECFEYFEAAKSLPVDLGFLLLKLDCQKERLLTWGEIVGISNIAPEWRNPELDSPKSELIKRCLTSITTLFLDTEKLRKEYGVESTNAPVFAENYLEYITSGRMNQFRKSCQWLAPSPNRQKQSSLLSKTKWAIHHKPKFETLINHIKETVTSLHDFLPIPVRSQEKMVHKDIASLSLSGLRQFQKACEEEYQTWSDIASAVVMASEIGTIDRRSVGEWLQDTNDVGHEVSETAASPNAPMKSNVTQKGFDLAASFTTKFYFVFTSLCFSNDSETGCNETTLGFMSLRQQGQTFLPEPGTSLTGERRLGQRITKSLDVKFSYDDLEMLRQSNYELSDFQNAAVEANLPLGNVYVYCAPSKYLTYKTRVDDRISASCCPESTKVDRLISLVTAVKQIEATDTTQTAGINTRWIEYIDRVWIEQRVYQLEEELYAQSVPRSATARGEELFAEFQPELKETGIVFLGELDHCLWMLQMQPFPWKARIPKETEIYKLTKATSGSAWKRIYLGTYTPRAFQHHTSYLKGASFPDLPRRETTSDSALTRRQSELSPRNPESQNLAENGIADSREIPNTQLAANLASSTSQNDTKDEAPSNVPIVSDIATGDGLANQVDVR